MIKTFGRAWCHVVLQALLIFKERVNCFETTIKCFMNIVFLPPAVDKTRGWNLLEIIFRRYLPYLHLSFLNDDLLDIDRYCIKGSPFFLKFRGNWTSSTKHWLRLSWSYAETIRNSGVIISFCRSVITSNAESLINLIRISFELVRYLGSEMDSQVHWEIIINSVAKKITEKVDFLQRN